MRVINKNIFNCTVRIRVLSINHSEHAAHITISIGAYILFDINYWKHINPYLFILRCKKEKCRNFKDLLNRLFRTLGSYMGVKLLAEL